MAINKSMRLCATVFLLLLLATACSTLAVKPVKPDIELISVMPLNIDISKQKLRFHLKVTNPNPFQLPIESVDFIARFNNTNIASGRNTQQTVIPANGEGILTLDVTAGIDRLVTSLKTLLEGQSIDLDYKLAGTVKVENWDTPIPFDVTGTMEEKI